MPAPRSPYALLCLHRGQAGRVINTPVSKYKRKSQVSTPTAHSVLTLYPVAHTKPLPRTFTPLLQNEAASFILLDEKIINSLKTNRKSGII